MRFFRRRERNNITSSVFFVLATIVAIAVFDYDVAILALLLTVFGDLVSALVGIRWGKHKLFRNKTIEGSLAGLVMNLLVGYCVLPTLPTVFVPMALIATIVEVGTNKLDDNLTVPMFSGFVGQMIVYIFVIELPGFPEPFGWIFNLFS